MDGGSCRTGRGWANQKDSCENGLRVRPESRIPPAKDILPVTIEHACANLQQQVGAPMAPAHLLFLHHAPAHHLVHRRFHKPGADPLASIRGSATLCSSTRLGRLSAKFGVPKKCCS